MYNLKEISICINNDRLASEKKKTIKEHSWKFPFWILESNFGGVTVFYKEQSYIYYQIKFFICQKKNYKIYRKWKNKNIRGCS